eukprot:9184033-Alexandrium_andersonii.AAC.1
MDTAAERHTILQLRPNWGVYPTDLDLQTFRAPTCTSKLDRAYNLHVAQQLTASSSATSWTTRHREPTGRGTFPSSSGHALVQRSTSPRA